MEHTHSLSLSLSPLSLSLSLYGGQFTTKGNEGNNTVKKTRDGGLRNGALVTRQRRKDNFKLGCAEIRSEGVD
jgi:hypothetical protein